VGPAEPAGGRRVRAGRVARALRGSREWKASLDDRLYTDAIWDPAEIERVGDEVSDDAFTTANLVSIEAGSHTRKLGRMRQLGATAVVLVNAAGADPEGLIRFYGEEVLPALRD
jgi:hypothetical protein